MKNIQYYILPTLFFVAVLLFFGVAYPQHLHFQEQYQMFLFSGSYVRSVVALPGGVADLLGRFCTQFFLYAWVGAAIIAVLLTAVQLLMLRLVSWGRFYGLSYVPSFLLWIFLLSEHALMGGVWAVVLTLAAQWLVDQLAEGWLRRILAVALVPVLYWIAGPVGIVFCLLQIRRPHHIAWYLGATLLFALLPIVLAYYLPVSPSSLWRGIHYYRYPTEFPTMLWVAVASVFLLVAAVRGLHKWAGTHEGWKTVAASFAVVATLMGIAVQKNSNFKAERTMAYDFMASHQQWNRILDAVRESKPNNQMGVTVQNLALAMRGMLLGKMLEYNQNGMHGLLPRVVKDATSPMPTAEAYYWLGMTSIAQRTVFEAQEAILDFQKSARCYKRLAQTNLINGDYAVARKYLLALRKTLFYSTWADETLALLGNEKAIAEHPEYGTLRSYTNKQNFYFSDEVTPAMLEEHYLSNRNNTMAYQYMMAAFMLTGDRENFYKYSAK